MSNRVSIAQYVPSLALQRLSEQEGPIPVPTNVPGEGAVLFIDISGFTSLTERLGRQGPVGAEQMSRLLATCFGVFVDTCTGHGGHIVDFAGDALFALWLDDPVAACAQRAAACALALQQAMDDLPPTEHTLSIKCSVGVGPFVVHHVGGAGFRHCLASGAAFQQATRAENHAEPGDVVLSEQAAALTGAQGKSLADGHVLIRELDSRPEPRALVLEPLADPTDERLEAYLPKAVLERIQARQGAWLAEFRRVTILFVNVIGLDDGSGVVGDDTNEVAVAVQAVVRRFGGRIQQFVVDDKGTVLLVAFGLPPRAHEDDPQRAVQAAFEIETALSELGLRSAIGLTTSRIFCGPLGGRMRQQYSVVGDRVNLAARLMQLAEDDILCDAPTAYHLSDEDYDALPPVRVKGKEAPIAVFRPYSVGDDGRPQRTTTPLMGRVTELAQLREHLRATADEGQGGLVVMEGEAGIGKTRLVQAAAAEAELLGIRTLMGTARAIEQNNPWFAWRPVFRDVLGLTGVPNNAGAQRRHILRTMRRKDAWFELAALLNPVLQVQVPETEVTAAMAGKRRTSRTLDLLVHLLCEAAAGEPTALILEDAHWLDSVSWGLLHQAVHDIEGLLVLVVTRPMAGPTAQPLTRVAAHASTHLVLEAISTDDALALVQHRLGVPDLPPSVGRLIATRAEGHPFFSEELARALIAGGVLQVSDGEARLVGDLSQLDLPDTVQGVIVSRIDALDAEQQLLLKVASVFGRVFPFEALRAVFPVDMPDAALRAHIEALRALDLVRMERPEPDLTFHFKHAISRDVTYDTLPYAQRRSLHRAVAEWHEQAHADTLDQWVATLSHHWTEAAGAQAADADALERASHYLERAGALALHSGAFTEASTLLQRAFDAHMRLPHAHDDVEDELRLLSLLGTAVFTTAGYGSTETLQVYQRALQLGEDAVDDRTLFPILWGLWIARHFSKAVDEALAVGERMMAIAERLEDPELVLQAHHALWTSLIQIPDHERARHHIQQGLPLYHPDMHESHCVRFGGHDPGACGYRALALAGWTTGQVDQAVTWAQQGVEMARRHDYSVATAQLAAAFVHKQRGEHERAAEVASELIAVSKRNRLGGFVPWAEMFLAWSQGRSGDLGGGIDALEAILPELGILDAGYFSMLLDLYVLDRRSTAGHTLLDALFEEVRRKDEHVYEPELLRYRAEFLSLEADQDEAERHFLAALALAREQGALSFELRAATGHARLRGDRDPDACRATLHAVVGRFEEGLDTEDLRAARQVLATL